TLWTNAFNGPNYDGGSVPQIQVDPNANVFLIGGTPGSSPGLYQIRKLTASGSQVWMVSHADFGISNSIISSSALDSAGNLYVLGRAGSLTNGLYADFVLMKFSSTGQALWTNRYTDPSGVYNNPFDFRIDPTGNIYVAGNSGSSFSQPHFTLVK